MIQGAGFVPSETVTAAIHSTTIQVGTFTANAIGVASGTIVVPVGTVVGYHEIYLTGSASGHVVIIPAWIITGETRNAGLKREQLRQQPRAQPAVGQRPRVAPSAGGGSLAYTGAGRGVWVTLVGGLLTPRSRLPTRDNVLAPPPVFCSSRQLTTGLDPDRVTGPNPAAGKPSTPSGPDWLNSLHFQWLDSSNAAFAASGRPSTPQMRWRKRLTRAAPRAQSKPCSPCWLPLLD